MRSATSPGSSGSDLDGPASPQATAYDEAPTPDLHIKETLSVCTQHVSSSGSQASLSVADGGSGGDEDHGSTTGIMSSRAYQLEMLNQSLKRNVIVAMDTGSGKTQVAILRIKAELEKCSSEQIVWFLAPTISLCAQQCEVIQLQANAVPTRLLTGNNNVDSWSEATWQAILSSARIVISTYQVLLDALSHAFVKMEHLALIVFDEAHNCVGNHPGSQIMTNFYHRQRKAGTSVPAILGLTASPSVRSQIEDLENLEATLDAQCVSPTLHREELIKCVKKPRLSYIDYALSAPRSTPSMQSLRDVYQGLNIQEDPRIHILMREPTDRNKRELRRVIMKRDTFVQESVKTLCSRSDSIAQELGFWAADRYVHRTIAEFRKRVDSSPDDFLDQWMNEERRYLSDVLRKVSISRPPEPPRDVDVSPKAQLLLKELLSTDDPVVGIVFVRERATVFMLCELLSAFPPISERYRIGAMVGTANTSAKRDIHDFADNKGQEILQSFRSGRINLLIATSVLEEGIDVPACNFVVCFDQPATIKAFIQRRGRARMRDSRLILFRDLSSKKPRELWESLEEELKKQYMDEEREFHQLRLIEESEQTGSTFYVVKETGARLDFNNAKQHLEHFCKVLSQGEYVDSRPDYIITQHRGGSKPGLRATVVLPAFIPAKLRHAESESTWLSEKNATKDAAFNAYKALYLDGLVNNNMLPFKLGEIPGVESRASMVAVEPPLEPWGPVAMAWKGSEDRWIYSLGCFDENDQLVGEYEIMLPIQLEQPRPIRIFLQHNKKCELRFSLGRPVTAAQAAEMPDHTSALLALHYLHRWPIEERHHVIRARIKDGHVSMGQIASVQFDPTDKDVINRQYFIRDLAKTPYLFTGIIPHKPPFDQVQHPFFEYDDKGPINVPYLHLTKWTRRADFLHRIHGDPGTSSARPYSWVLPQPWATVDTAPVRYAQFGMLIPSVMHALEVIMVAKNLATTVLNSLGFTNLELVREAISARSAAEPLNYERLEFLGDSILKYCTSIQATAEHSDWPEGYLSFFRDRLIANSRLSRAALERGLSKFILNKAFTGLKWRPLYVDDLLVQEDEPNPPERKLSTKTLADVVESLIGASYQEGGIKKAMSCISLFLDEVEWNHVDENRSIIFNATRKQDSLPSVLEPLERLIGYSFKNKALLIEATTHASYVADGSSRSLERLEYVGDAILDNIIVTKLFAVEPPIPHHQMHMLKTATVNSDFLAFMVLEHGLYEKIPKVTDEGELEEEDAFYPLWKFMRHASTPIGIEQAATVVRHGSMRREILTAMEQGTHYPWALLARLQTKKFFSDIFESLLGAVWVDSGSMDTCAAVASRFGIQKYLDRMLRDKVHVQHPKEELGKWAVTETVTYDIRVMDGSNGLREYVCRVLVGERVVTEVDGGVNKEEVKTKAATEAVRILTREKEAGGDDGQREDI